MNLLQAPVGNWCTACNARVRLDQLKWWNGGAWQTAPAATLHTCRYSRLKQPSGLRHANLFKEPCQSLGQLDSETRVLHRTAVPPFCHTQHQMQCQGGLIGQANRQGMSTSSLLYLFPLLARFISSLRTASVICTCSSLVLPQAGQGNVTRGHSGQAASSRACKKPIMPG